MSILDTYKAYQTPISLLLVVFGPPILRKALRYLNNRNRAPSSPSSGSTTKDQPISDRLKVFLTLHTLYHLAHLLIPPFDLFSTPHLPILAPNDILRSRLQTTSGSTEGLNPLVDLLLVRLQNLDNRILYLRYGHAPVQGCLWCRSPLDYLLATLPDIFSRYLSAVIVIIGLGNETLVGKGAGLRGRRWTSPALWTLAAACLGEVGVRHMWDLRISNGDTLHLSHKIHLARTALLLTLPLLHTFLPTGPTLPNAAALVVSLQNAQNTQRLTSLLRETVSQDEGLRAISAQAGRTERSVKNTVRNAPEVRQAIEDYRIAEGSVNHARQWVDEGWRGLVGIGRQT